MPAPALEPPPRRWLWLLLPLLAVAVARLLWLSLDPPAAMGEPTIMDEGLWASAARGKVMFGDWFADDLGEGYLMAPLHSFLLVGVYKLFGIGLWQTRLPAALASLVTAAILGRFVQRRHGNAAGAFTVLLLGVTQLIDWHSRMALLESEQACWITASFVSLFAAQPSRAKAFAAGMLMAAALATKLNSVDFGVVPLGAAFLLTARTEPGAWRRAAATVAGGLLGLAVLMLPMLLAHWPQFTAMLAAESGMQNYSGLEHLLRLGLFGASEDSAGRLARWQLLRYAPAVTLGAWLLLVARMHARERAAGGEAALLVWFLVTLLMTELACQHVTRRLYLAAVPAAAAAAQLLATRPRASGEGGGFWRWLVLLAAPALALKPTFANAVAAALPLAAPQVTTVPAGSATVASCVGGWLWLPPLLLLAWWLRRSRTCGLARPLLRFGPVAVALFALAEISQLGCLPPHRRSMLDAQRQLATLVPEGSTVMGMHAATLLLPERVRTVRRVVPGRYWSAPRSNADAFARLQPRFLLDYVDAAARELGDAIAQGFRPVARFDLLPQRSGKPCYRLQLWQR